MFSKYLQLTKLHFNLTIGIGWIVALLGHFYLVPNVKIPILIGIADPFVHGLIALLVIFTFYAKDIITLKELGCCVLIAILIDIDHAFAAQSLDLADWIKLTERPPTHSIAFGIFLGLLLSAIFRRKKMLLFTYLIAIVLSSHVMRDGTDGVSAPWNYPLYPTQITELGFFLTFIIISFLQAYVIKKLKIPSL